MEGLLCGLCGRDGFRRHKVYGEKGIIVDIAAAGNGLKEGAFWNSK